MLAQPRAFQALAKHRETAQTVEAPPMDPFRDTAIRYFGFANEITEAGKASGNAFFKAINPLGWTVAFGYGISDALNKAFNKHADVMHETQGDKKAAKANAIAMLGEVLLFHSMASWFGPVYAVIKPVHHFTEKLLHKMNRAPGHLPTAAALGSILVIPKILDPLAELVIKKLYEPLSHGLVNAYLERGKK